MAFFEASLVKNGSSDNYLVKYDILYKFENVKEMLVVPEEMQREIIRNIHERGHFAISKTDNLVRQEFYIAGLRKKVETIIANCVDCILYNRKQGKVEGFLHPIPKGDKPLETYHIDHIGPLPLTNKKYHYIFTVVDAFTKFAWFRCVCTHLTSIMKNENNIGG